MSKIKRISTTDKKIKEVVIEVRKIKDVIADLERFAAHTKIASCETVRIIYED